jgi:hypothetical protein
MLDHLDNRGQIEILETLVAIHKRSVNQLNPVAE